eukprot:SAG31_NODE_13706_length_852_cov_0.997344_1_plen_55_part_00
MRQVLNLVPVLDSKYLKYGTIDRYLKFLQVSPLVILFFLSSICFDYDPFIIVKK